MAKKPFVTKGPKKKPRGKPFEKGWKGGPGNPHAAQTSILRAALLAAVTPEDIHDIARTLIKSAKGGDIGAIKELFDRTMGKASQPVELSGTVNLAPLFQSKAQADAI